jgi:anti-anti-sigma factor
MTDASFAIESCRQADRVVLHLTGELDLAAREALLAEVERLAGRQKLVLDFSNVQFIDASVVGVLFHLARVARESGERLAVVDGRGMERLIWQLTRCPEVCPIFVSIQEATQALEA